jgi:hypothetical protein
MSDYLLKSLLAIIFLAIAVTSFLSMMTLMGKTSPKTDPAKLRQLHKVAGYAWFVLLLPLVYFGADFLSELGEGLSVRAVFHFVLAALLLAVALIKLLVVRSYRQFLKYAPGLGMTLFVLTVVIFLITAGYFFLRGGNLD